MIRESPSLTYKIYSLLICIIPVFIVAFFSQQIEFQENSNSKQNIPSIAFAQSCNIQQQHIKRHNNLHNLVQTENGDAAFRLGRLYKSTQGPECQELAYHWFSKSVKWGEAKAYAELGNAYEKGRGVKRNSKNAIKHFYASAKHRFVSSAFSLVFLVEKTGSVKKAQAYLAEFMPLIEAGIASGNAVAARSLARLYHRSKLIERDIAKAIHYYQLASQGNDSVAKHDLALILLKRNNGNVSADEIINLLIKSAELGYPAAFTAMGRLHLKSMFGLQRSNAIKWLEEGAEKGHGGAYLELAKLHLNGEILSQNIKQAYQYASQGAKLGHSGSLRLLSTMQNEGLIKVENSTLKRGS